MDIRNFHGVFIAYWESGSSKNFLIMSLTRIVTYLSVLSFRCKPIFKWFARKRTDGTTLTFTSKTLLLQNWRPIPCEGLSPLSQSCFLFVHHHPQILQLINFLDGQNNHFFVLHLEQLLKSFYWTDY